MKRSDFLQRLITIAGFGAFNIQALIPKRKIYLQQFFVAGFRHYKGMEFLSFIREGDLLELRREPGNKHDESAIALYWQQEKIGFIPAGENEMTAKLMDTNALPLLGIVTHLNTEVKPWENVAAAVYFLQDETVKIPAHAAYLQQLIDPTYATTPLQEKNKLFDQIFDYPNRIVDVEAIEQEEIRKYLQVYFADKKNHVYYEGKLYTEIGTNSIYTFMYDVNPLKWITADNGKRYILFDYSGTD